MLVGAVLSRIRRGFCVPEVLVTAAGLSAILGLTATTPQMMLRTIHRSDRLRIATDLCEERLEATRDAGYARLPRIPDGQLAVSVPFSVTAELPGARGLLICTRIDDGFSATTEDTGRRRVDVRILWDDGGTQRGQVDLASLMHRDR